MNGADLPPLYRMTDLRQVAGAVEGALEGRAVDIRGVATDTRAIAAGELFVALKGERFDGHAYVEEAARRGAAAALVSTRVAHALPQVVVADTRLALGRLAAHWRSRYALPLVALTGSNGKTTVKEMIAAILAAHCGSRDEVLATEGNLNNDIGMPLTLLRLREHHRYAVIEMGMNHEGEIDYLTRIAEPTVALVNNAQRAHVGILGSLEAIARAKGEIYAGLKPSGIAVVNEDDAFAAYWKGLNAKPGSIPRRIVTFGLSQSADVRATIEGAQLRVVTPQDAFAVTLRVSGEHNVRNALAACAAAHALAIPVHAMQQALRDFAGVPGRLQRRTGIGGATVIDDSYNANPESMKAAIRVLAAERGRRVLVMGDMGELGSESSGLHAEVGAFAREAGLEALLALGGDSREAVAAFGAGGRHFAGLDALLQAATDEARAGATLLVKGSRFMQMERVADALAPGDGHAA
ncbi:MAG TPA: UDP-N-acetylmuramoyl-tripeptide--D-alanyl-D-alanine ligase [Usitatibacter sp.]|nr:UDP-N-acetylmuramoyl-tripeptide--D-alanyl-D-alanine ligase [Usitatibacter sp.]